MSLQELAYVYPGQTVSGLQETRGPGGDPEAPGAGKNTITAGRGPQNRDWSTVP